MDLNVDNYSVNELFNALQISKSESQTKVDSITVIALQKCLLTKIEKIKLIDTDATELPVSKENLIEFYTRAFFKIVNDKNMISELKKEAVQAPNPPPATMNETQEQKEYRDAYGNAAGHVYNTSYANPNQASPSIQSALLSPMPQTHVVQSNSNFVTQHKNFDPIPTFNSNLKAGVLNPLVRKSITKVLNINSRFRTNYLTTDSANFTIDLPSSIKKVVSMKLMGIELPKTVYSFSSKLGSNNFKIAENTDAYKIIEISNGVYTGEELAKEISFKLLNILNANVYTLTYNKRTGKMTFLSTPNPPGTSVYDFSLNFEYNNDMCESKMLPLNSNFDKNQLTLGWMLGFRGHYNNGNKLSSKSVHNPEYCEQKIKRATKFNQNGTACLDSKIPNKYCTEIYEKNYDNISFEYGGETSFTGESLFDQYGTKYFLLSVNDYQNNHGETIISPFKDQTLASNHILAKLPVVCDTGCKDTCHPERIYFGPTNISKLQITLYDEFGRIVDFNNADYSMTIELEVLYDL